MRFSVWVRCSNPVRKRSICFWSTATVFSVGVMALSGAEASKAVIFFEISASLTNFFNRLFSPATRLTPSRNNSLMM